MSAPPPVLVIPWLVPTPGPTSEALVALANEMLVFARRCEMFNDHDRASQYHQAAARYASAANAAFANNI